jgi:phage I-like protein
MKLLREEKERYDKYVMWQTQTELNREVCRIMQAVNLTPTATTNGNREGPTEGDVGVEHFRELANEYRVLSAEYRSMNVDVMRAKERSQRVEEARREYLSTMETKRKLEAQT